MVLNIIWRGFVGVITLQINFNSSQKSFFKLAKSSLVYSLSVLKRIWRVSLRSENIDFKSPQQGDFEIQN